MTLRSESPLSRSVNVERLPKDRAEIVVEASPAECEALARDFKIPALRDLVRFDAEREHVLVQQQGELVGLRVDEREVKAREDLFDRRILRGRRRGIDDDLRGRSGARGSTGTDQHDRRSCRHGGRRRRG